MRFSQGGVRVVLFVLLGAFCLAQSSQNAPTAPPDQSSPQAQPTQTAPQTPAQENAAPPRSYARGHGPIPCWKVAGITPEMVNQRWQIEDNAKGQINTVCADSSLTAQKRQDRIHQINEQTEQEIAKFIPANELSSFKSCQAERDRERAQYLAKHPEKAQKELGPCGGIIPQQPGAPAHSHEHQTSAPPNH